MIIISVLITIIIIFLLFCLLGMWQKKKRKATMKEVGDKALDYIANHTYEQMLRDVNSSQNITTIALQANILVKNFAKHTGHKNDRIVYKDIQKWRREGKI